MTDSNDMKSWNQSIIDEFRANAGKVGGQFEGAPLLLLHSTGAKSGEERISPMMYQQVGEGIAVFASKAGAPSNPDWYFNLKANPNASIEIGTETRLVVAREVVDAERDAIWTQQKADYPGFADYESATSRVIPVFVLEEVPGA